MDTRFGLTKRIKQAFDAPGLSLPYPHQVSMERADVRPRPPAVRRKLRSRAGVRPLR